MKNYRTLIIKIVLFSFLTGILLLSLYIPIGLYFGYVQKVMLTPYPFTDFYFRDITGILFLALINSIVLYFLLKIKKYYLYIFLTITSLFLSYLSGQQLRLTYFDCYITWSIFPIKHYEIKNLELLQIQQAESSPELKWNHDKFPNARNFNEDKKWLYFQYGEKDSCSRIFNMYPQFLKLKKQQIK